MKALLVSIVLAAFSPPTEVKRNLAYDGGTPGPLIHGTDGYGVYPLRINDAGTIMTQRLLDPSETTAFGEQRVSVPYTLYDMGSGRYGRDTREVSVRTDGGGAVADVVRESGFTLTVPGTANASAQARTNTWFRYQAGRGQLITMTLVQGATPAGQTRRWGYYDQHDGLYFQVENGVLSVVRRTSTSENTGCVGCHAMDGGTMAWYEQQVPQSSWNVARPTIDWTKGNIWQIQFQWLGVGTVKWFVNGILVHEMIHAGQKDNPYMSTATLPLSWEVINLPDAGASDSGTMTAICANVTSQSGQAPPEYSYAYSKGATAVLTAEIPVLSMRVTSRLGGTDNRVTILPKNVVLSNGETVAGRIALVNVYMNGTLTGATWAVAGPTNSGAEFDTAASAISGGEMVGSFAVAAAATGDIDLSLAFGEHERKMRRDAFSGNDILTVTVQYTATGGTCYPSIRWVEVK